ncbi:MAG: hypothetical protein HC803_05105 [Saprospiraceae bacterium]|nr:hypothetical protein [Saprospiraceae bacterium]
MDEDGNSYSTGYFKTGMQEQGNQFIYPDCEASYNCSDFLFLMKRDKNGKLLWMRYTIGNARPSDLAIDKDGFINMVGTVYSNKISFSTPTDTLLNLKRPNKDAAIFICKYDKNGQPVKTKILSQERYEHAYTFIMDDEDNLYIGGSFIYYLYKKRSDTKQSYLVYKFDKNWDLVWEKAGDTTGISGISEMDFDDKNNLIVTGSYVNNLKIGGKILQPENPYNSQKPFVAKYNSDGQFQWISEVVSETGYGVGCNIACDTKGNSFVIVNSPSNTAFLSKINQKGELDWQLKIGSSVTFSDMILDDKNDVYLSGAGSYATFPTKGIELFSFQNRGSTDFFMVKYSSKGNLEWLKVGGGKRTDYCESIALYGDKLIAFVFRLV